MPGQMSVLTGQAQYAQVLRNLCYQIHQKGNGHWDDLVQNVPDFFGVKLLPPQFIAERSEITMAYEDERGNRLDLNRRFSLAHMYANPGAILLLDEPDAHLEILRQRET